MQDKETKWELEVEQGIDQEEGTEEKNEEVLEREIESEQEKAKETRIRENEKNDTSLEISRPKTTKTPSFSKEIFMIDFIA